MTDGRHSSDDRPEHDPTWSAGPGGAGPDDHTPPSGVPRTGGSGTPGADDAAAGGTPSAGAQPAGAPGPGSQDPGAQDATEQFRPADAGGGDATTPTSVPAWAATSTGPDTPGGTPRGRIRQQDENTTPREPTLAEKRAREQKVRADREAVRLKEARSKKTKRILIGAGATVGVVALIAAVYAASGPDEEITAQCVDDKGVVVPDENCGGNQSNGQVSDGHGGFAFVPIFLGGGGRQYHYNYGSSGGVGTVATGGTVNPPPAASKSGTTVRSGTSGGTISRGGLGVGGSSSSKGGFGGSSSGS